MEIKIVLFQPTDGHYAADIYIDGERIHCGRGVATEQKAVSEALDRLRAENYNWRSRLRLPEWQS